MLHTIEHIPPPIILAHRGASAHAPENTLAAFRLAVAHGADGVELDIRLTADGQVVVIHEARVDKVTDGHGPVQSMTLADIKRLDAGQHFSPAFAGERIPTLAQVFEALDPPALINIELKNNMSPFDALPEKTAVLIKQYSVEARVIISCFNPLSLSRIQHFLPDVPVALLALPGSAGCLSRCWLGRWFSPRLIHPYFGDVNAKMITAEHHQNRRVIAYTVDDPAVMERLFNAKIDGIITNDPRLARRVLA